MTERERLIELLNHKKHHGINIIVNQMDDRFNYSTEITNEQLTDYLLENNVKPLSFKINDIVYGISRGQIIPIQIDTIQYTNQGIDIQGHNKEYFGYSIIHLDVDNKTGLEWYYTKEEADKALEEKKKE